MKSFTTTAVAALLAASTAAPAMAQTYGAYGSVQTQTQYQRSQQEYDRAYADYQAAQAQYQRDRAEYDRRYGSGAYDRYYNRYPAPTPGSRDPYNDYNRDPYGRDPYNRDPYNRDPYNNDPYNRDPYNNGRYDPYNNSRYDPYDRYRNSPCERRSGTVSGDRAASTIIGALIGGAIGVGVAGDSSETEGAVLGAVVGGAIGNQIAANREDDRWTAKCDASGYYYTYDQTYPYQESDRYRGQRSGRYDSSYYVRQRCRLAVAPSDYGGRANYRYVRVCPDRNNRYRITG